MAWSQVKAIGIGKVIAALLSALTVVCVFIYSCTTNQEIINQF